MRNLEDVIDQMLEAGRNRMSESLDNSLRSLKQSARFAAPEIQAHWWKQTAQVLGNHLNTKMDEEWVQEVQTIFNGDK